MNKRKISKIVLTCIIAFVFAFGSFGCRRNVEPGSFTLTVNTQGAGTGEVSASPTGTEFEEGVPITVTASAALGSVFEGWFEGNERKSTALVYNFYMPARDLTLSARFALDANLIFNLNIIVDQPNMGIVLYDADWIVDGTAVAGHMTVLTAVPEMGHSFVGWFAEDGEQLSSELIYAFTMPANDFTIIARFVRDLIQSAVAVANEGGGIPTGSGTFVEGSSVTVTATPNEGWRFSHWTEYGATVSTNATYTFVMPAHARNLVAVFTQIITYAITVSNYGFGTVVGGGSFEVGTPVSLTATPNTDNRFVGWREGVASEIISIVNPLEFNTPAGGRTLVAVFESDTYAMIITTVGAGSVTGNPGPVSAGTSITLTANPNVGIGASFIGWYENNIRVYSSLIYTFSMPVGGRTLEARFTSPVPTYTANVTVTPTTGGSVTGNPGGVEANTAIELVAVSAAGYRFVGWREGVATEIISPNATLTFNMLVGGRTLVAVFELDVYLVSLSTSGIETPGLGIGAGSVSGGGTMISGTNVTVVAAPATGSRFVHWLDGGNIVSTTASFTFEVTNSRSLVAIFELDLVTVSITHTGSGTVAGGGGFSSGMTATLTATPNAGNRFVGWFVADTLVSANTSYSFVVTENIAVVGRFETIGFSLPDYVIPPDREMHNWRRALLPVAREDGFEVDGIFDEDEWQREYDYVYCTEYGGDIYQQVGGQVPITFTRTIGGYEFEMELTTYFGVRGLHVMTTVITGGQRVAYDPSNTIYNNTSVILNISPDADLTINTIQLRVGLTGRQEQWFGRRSADGYPFARGVVPSVSMVQHVLNDGSFQPFTYMGEVREDATAGLRGFNVETFMPWTSMGLTQAPALIRIMPELNVSIQFGQGRSGMLVPPGMAFNAPATWARFDVGGYSHAVVDGMIDVDGDLSDWEDLDAFTPERAVEVKAIPYDDNRGYTIWSFLGEHGLFIALVAHHNHFNEGYGDTGQYYHTQWYRNTNLEIWFNTALNAANSRIYTHRWVAPNGRSSPALTSAWVTEDRGVGTPENPRFTSTIEIFMPRSEIPRGIFLEGTEDEHVYINFNFRTGSGAMNYEQLTINRAGRVLPGQTQWRPFYHHHDIQNQIPVFNDGMHGLGNAGDRLARDYNNTENIVIDGDLSDWAGREASSISLGNLSTAGITTNGITFWAFLGVDGLYLAARALHTHHRTGSDTWHHNTNFEFFINGRHQHFVNPYWSSPYVQAVMATLPPGIGAGESGVAGHYLSTVEMFIPNVVLARFGGVSEAGTSNEHIRIGFAAGMGNSNMAHTQLMGNTDLIRTSGWWTSGYRASFSGSIGGMTHGGPYVLVHQHFVYNNEIRTTVR
ncbi:MAG: hypothetical protein FWC80_02555 [Firmicutes bacterium]|nr:hypothetical protein [Bacillota bacterium]